MSHPHPPQPAKLVIGLFLKEKALLPEVAEALESCFGGLEMASLWFDFNYTDYYDTEMGGPLYRRMLVFRGLIAQEALADIKCATNDLEKRFVRDNKRRVNLDPGYLLYERFVLATGKNFSHRIYIGRGIYADLTLVYQKGAYRSLPWTYPDYAADTMRAFLAKVREHYAADRAAQKNAGAINGPSCLEGDPSPCSKA